MQTISFMCLCLELAVKLQLFNKTKNIVWGDQRGKGVLYSSQSTDTGMNNALANNHYYTEKHLQCSYYPTRPSFI